MVKSIDGSSRARHQRCGFLGRDTRYIASSSTSTLQLILNDGSETTIARFREKSLGIIGKAHPAQLEIQPAGEAIMDTILVTFIYIEKIREGKKRSMRAAATSGGGG